ncbi:protein of unknown function [Methylocaldum szegediense]|uniref:Secreted protein n=1 Tax=Methylocaldum szegediense TaxID=73780 RepID=A0ABM9HXF8_9GAMM|nr:protein of unknown function [Methylocaldum szegediense]
MVYCVLTGLSPGSASVNRPLCRANQSLSLHYEVASELERHENIFPNAIAFQSFCLLSPTHIEVFRQTPRCLTLT